MIFNFGLSEISEVKISWVIGVFRFILFIFETENLFVWNM